MSLAKKVGIVALGTTAALSAIGGLAYVGNASALHEPITVNVYPGSIPSVQVPSLCQQLAPASAVPAAPAAVVPASTSPVTLPAAQGSLGVQIPGATLRQLLADPLAQGAAQAQQTANQHVARVCLTPGSARVEVRMPLPTGDQSLLHVGNLNLPSFGERALQTETVNFGLDFTAAPIQTGLTVQVRPVPVDPAMRGPGVPLGAVEVVVTSATGDVAVSGAAHIQAQLSEAQRDRLGANQTDLVEKAADQRLEFAGRLHGQPGVVARTTSYFWAVPDRTGDGKADVAVTQTADLKGLEGLEVQLDRLEAVGPKPSGLIAGTVHSQVSRLLVGQLKANLGRLNGELRQAAGTGAHQGLETMRVKLESEINGRLSDAYGQVPTVRGQGLSGVTVAGDGLQVSLGQGPSTPGGEVLPGQVGATVDLDLANRELAGATDWNAVLAQARTQTGLPQLEFGKDRSGQPVLPRLAVHNGKLALDADLVLGLGPGQSIRSLVSLPLKVEAKDGQLALQPDAKNVTLTQPEEAGHSLLGALAPRLISSMLAKTELPGTTVGLPAGLQVEGVRVNAQSVTLVLRPSVQLLAGLHSR